MVSGAVPSVGAECIGRKIHVGGGKKKKEKWMCSGPPGKSYSAEVQSLTPKALTLSPLAWIHNALLSLASICFFPLFLLHGRSYRCDRHKDFGGAEKRQPSTPAHPVIVGHCVDRARHCPRPLYLKVHFECGVLLTEMLSAALHTVGHFMSTFYLQ